MTQRRTLQLLLPLRPRHRPDHLIGSKREVGEDGEEGGEGQEEGGEEGEGGGVEGEEGEGADTRVLETEVQGKHIYSQYITVYVIYYTHFPTARTTGVRS